MATEEITISELELADEVLADMTLPVDTATETRAVTLKQLRAWLGSSLPTGFIIPAVGKISDERFTLLDGKTLSRAGTYEAFCNKVVSEVQAGNWFACSEDEYNSDISTYGQCGKFVVSNDYIRIPTITRFIGATITLSEIGKTYKESLPNITGSAGRLSTSSTGEPTASDLGTGALYLDSAIKSNQGGSAGNVPYRYMVKFNASRSSSTYQDGAKVQPDHTKYPYYMVISTEGQTSTIEIDVNQIYEDMNLKADVNLSNTSNISSVFKKKAVQWGIPDYSAGTARAWGGFTATTDGFLYMRSIVNEHYSRVRIDGGEVFYVQNNQYTDGQGSLAPIKSGQKVTVDGVPYRDALMIFYPCEGVI